MTDQLTMTEAPQVPEVRTDGSEFEMAWRKAQALAASSLVPIEYRGKPENCMIALEVAQRIGSSAFLVMQNSHVIHGKVSWASVFVIASINGCGRFSPLRYAMSGKGETRECFAYAKDLSDGELLEGPPVSIVMAKAEKWYQKNGSKWPTMPELMLRYRAATFFGRLYAPEILAGLHTAEETLDFSARVPVEVPAAAAAIDGLRDVTAEADDTEGEEGPALKPSQMEEPPDGDEFDPDGDDGQDAAS